MRKFKGYINYFLMGVLKTHYFKQADKEKIKSWVRQFGNPSIYTYVGMKVVEDHSNDE